MRSTLKNHMKQFGDDGYFTYHAGLTIEQAAAIGAETIKLAALRTLKAGDKVVIRGSDIECRIRTVLGACLVLKWPLPDWRSHDALQVVNKGHWSYGDVLISRAHVEPALQAGAPD